MTKIIIKQFMAYSLLLIGTLVVKKYIEVTLDKPTSKATNPEETATAIVAVVENMEYVFNQAAYIPETDHEAFEEAMAWVFKARKDLEALLQKYIQEDGLVMDQVDGGIIEVQDRRGRGVKLSLEDLRIVETPDQISYKKQLKDLKHTNWEEQSEEMRRLKQKKVKETERLNSKDSEEMERLKQKEVKETERLNSKDSEEMERLKQEL